MSGFGHFNRTDTPDTYRSWVDDVDHGAPIIPAQVNFILGWDMGQLYFFGEDGLKGENSYFFTWEGFTYHYMGERKATSELWEHLRKNQTVNHYPAEGFERGETSANFKDFQARWFQVMQNFWDWKFGIQGRLTEKSFQEFETYRLYAREDIRE